MFDSEKWVSPEEIKVLRSNMRFRWAMTILIGWCTWMMLRNAFEAWGRDENGMAIFFALFAAIAFFYTRTYLKQVLHLRRVFHEILDEQDMAIRNQTTYLIAQIDVHLDKLSKPKEEEGEE